MLKKIKHDPTLNSQGQGFAPGKLYLAGEYAVLAPRQPAILLALNRYVKVTIKPSSTLNQGILSQAKGQADYHYQRQNGSIPQKEAYWTYCLAAIQIVEVLFRQKGQVIADYHLETMSDLVEEVSGKKFGLGSSGAITVATIRALLDFYGYQADSPLDVYKLAVLALVNLGNNGSFGDLAAAAFGGWVYYQAPDRQWLADQVSQNQTIDFFLENSWPNLQIESLPVPSKIDFLVAWTQSPASSDHFVANFKEASQQEPQLYQEFLAENKDAVLALKTALIQDDVGQSQSLINKIGQQLDNLSHHLKLGILTPQLETMISLAQVYGYAAKSSGAGGGDCGIALGGLEARKTDLIRAWEKQEITYLDLQISQIF